MRKLFLLLILIPSIVWAQAPNNRIAVMFSQMMCSSAFNSDEMLGITDLMTKQGWDYDIINVDRRTWFADTSDAEYFEKRYRAIIIVDFDGHNACVLAGGFATNFQNSAGISGTARGPLGGRLRIPVYILASRVIPSASTNDTSTTGNYVAGIGSAGTFARPSEATAGTWRSKVIIRMPTPDDTLYIEPLEYACRINWTGAGSVAATSLVDTTNGLGSCVPGVDSIMVSWRWQPRSDRPGVHYALFRNSRFQAVMPAFWVLQHIAVEVGFSPPPIKIEIMEHNPFPTSLTNARVTNFRNFYAKMKQNNIARRIAVKSDPADVVNYNGEVLETIKESLKDKFCTWHQFSNEANGNLNLYSLSDTTGGRIGWNQLAKTATSDSMNMPVSAYNNKTIVSSGGLVGVAMGKVLRDAGVEIVESTISIPNPAGLAFQQSGLRGTEVVYPLLGGDSRTITVRGTRVPGEAATFTSLQGANGGAEYIAEVFSKEFFTLFYTTSSLFWHTSTLCGDDPYAQWLYGDVLGRYLRQFNKVITISRDW